MTVFPHQLFFEKSRVTKRLVFPAFSHFADFLQNIYLGVFRVFLERSDREISFSRELRGFFGNYFYRLSLCVEHGGMSSRIVDSPSFHAPRCTHIFGCVFSKMMPVHGHFPPKAVLCP
jgi:hypothetical protein